jgi:diguanylate cyclase (GGDEF)-like protein
VKDVDKVNILIVDDREENLLVLENILEEKGLNIVRANSGNEALSLALKRSFALILLDVQMPEMDGFETAELLRGMDITREVPIIFITAISVEKEYVFKGYESGCVDYLSKPVDPAILNSKVSVFVDLYRKKRELKQKARELEEANRKLKDLTSIDGLTGIPNRRRLDQFLDVEWRRGARNATPVSFIMVDIDYFKLYNDTYGHQEGDNCLRQVAAALNGFANRPGDIVSRYGGEEFGVILGETDMDGAVIVAKRMKEAVERLCIKHSASVVCDHVTVSMGVATLVPDKNNTSEALIAAADSALYLAKDDGRNRITSTPVEMGA